MARGVFTALTDITAAAFNDCFNPPSCRVTNSGAISLTNNTVTALTFDTETWDVGGMHSTSSNTSRITIPTGGAGLYLFAGCVQFASNATGFRELKITLNGGGSTAISATRVNAINGSTTRMECTALYKAQAGDYFELTAYQNSGGALNLDSSATAPSPIFSATWLAVY